MNAKEWLEKLEHGSDGSDAWDMLKDLRKSETEVEKLKFELDATHKYANGLIQEIDIIRTEAERMKHENFQLWEALQFRKTAEELLQYVEQERKGGEG